MIREFNSLTLKELHNEITTALKDLETKHGINIKLGRMTYNEDSVRMTLQRYLNKNGSPNTDKIIFDKHCTKYGLSPDDYGKTFTFEGDTFKIIGIAPKSTKYPILCKNSKDVTYKLTVNDCCEALGYTQTYTVRNPKPMFGSKTT